MRCVRSSRRLCILKSLRAMHGCVLMRRRELQTDSEVQAFPGQSLAARGSQRAMQAGRSLHRVDQELEALKFALKFVRIGVKPIGATSSDHGCHRLFFLLPANHWPEFLTVVTLGAF